MNVKTCFVLAPIGRTRSATRESSDKVLRHVILSAVEECGYQAIRSDEVAEPGIITRQVIDMIVNAPLAVADLTETNPNVFYELALRHWLQKPLIQVIEEGESIPFDVAGMKTIVVNHKDIESVEGARRQIIDQIHSLEARRHPIVTSLQESALWRKSARMLRILLAVAATAFITANIERANYTYRLQKQKLELEYLQDHLYQTIEAQRAERYKLEMQIVALRGMRERQTHAKRKPNPRADYIR